MALTGFDEVEARSIAAALAEGGAISRVVGAGPALPGVNPFAYYDLCIVNLSQRGECREVPSSQSQRPTLFVCDSDDLGPLLGLLNEHGDFLVRPFRNGELLLRAQRLIRTSEFRLKPVHDSEHLRVLIADDDETAAVLIATILRHAGFQCECAQDGVQATEMARRKTPDVILMDVRMPEMDGFEALAALRNKPETRNVPIIMVTADQNEADIVRGLTLGADDYITKPFNSREMIARINRVLRRSDARRAA
ncbi:MAG TPA: response regulator [Candidatus Binataceae bacterium]|nr:response regulator [Candidatus Binataceae bacterium]